jgi:hypothetical protein
VATITAAAGGGAWTTGASWVGGVAPSAADDAVLDATSGNITVGAGAVCRSLDCTGYTGTLTHTAAVTLTIGDATAGAGNVALKLAAGMTYTLGSTSTSAISFVSNSATQQTIATGGKALGSLTFNGTGSWQLQDACTATAGTVTLTKGSLDTNNQTCVWGDFQSDNSNTRAILGGTSAITTAGQWNDLTTTGLTRSMASTTLTLSAVGGYMRTTGTFGTVIWSGAGAGAQSQPFTCATLTIIGIAARNAALTMAGVGPTVTGTLTINGNNAVNRFLVCSSTPGAARTISAGTVSVSNTDFQDVTAAGAANWDLSAATGGAGDAGGNTGITFTTSATQTHIAGAGGNWSDAAQWTTRVPLPQDDVVVDGSVTGTITVDMPRLGRSVTFTGFAGTATFSSFANSVYGSLTLASGMTVSGTLALTLGGRSSYTLTSAGKTLTQAVTVNNGAGTYTLADAFATAAALTVTSGTLNTNGQTVTALTYVQGGGNATLGASTVSLTSTAVGSIVSVTAGTINAGTSTIVIANASTNSRTFAGGGKTYATLTYTVAGSTGALVLTGANTFATLNFSDATNARTLTLPSSTTTTVTGTFGVAGTAGKLMTVNSSSGGVAATLSKTSGVVSADYLSIQDSTAAGGASWYAGANSTKVSGVTGWFFTAPSNYQFLQFA